MAALSLPSELHRWTKWKWHSGASLTHGTLWDYRHRKHITNLQSSRNLRARLIATVERAVFPRKQSGMYSKHLKAAGVVVCHSWGISSVDCLGLDPGKGSGSNLVVLLRCLGLELAESLSPLERQIKVFDLQHNVKQERFLPHEMHNIHQQCCTS